MPLMPKPKPGEAVPIVAQEMVVLVRRTADKKLETLLFDFEGHCFEAYGLVCADIIRHVADAYGVDVADVHEWVQKELDNPTTDLTRIGPN